MNSVKDQEKKTESDEGKPSMAAGRKIATVTWARFQSPIMNPGVGTIATYIKNANGKPNGFAGGELDFFWPVGADYIYAKTKDGEVACVPITNLSGWNVRF